MLETKFRKIINYLGVYATGVVISSSFILWTNDIFYNIVFRKINSATGGRAEIWQEIKPRETFGKGPKSTFMKHQITEDKDDDQRRYHAYLEQIKKGDNEAPGENQKLYENIFEKGNKKL